MNNTVYLNGKFIAYQKATIPLLTHALHYGTGSFEGIRAYWNESEKTLNVFRVVEHYERLINSCKILMIDLGKSPEELADITIQLLKKNHFKEDVYIRPLAFKGAEQILTFNLPKLENSSAILAIPMGHYLNVSAGVKVGVSSWRRVDDNSMPARAKLTGSYINTALAKEEATAHGHDEAIFLTHDGHVCEGSAENIFMIKKGVVSTPPVSDNILEGVTRNTVMEILAKEFNTSVIERSIDRSELYSADELFFTGTGAEVTPITAVDRRVVGAGKPGTLTLKLQKTYFEIVRGKNQKYRSWITPVKSRNA